MIIARLQTLFCAEIHHTKYTVFLHLWLIFKVRFLAFALVQ